MRTAEQSDADLVTGSLRGDRDAFCRIVERYQTLVSSLAYCATGDFSRSEDLAQETFVTAWKELRQLREPGKLRSWLCQIARFLISKEFRRQAREPVHQADPLESVDLWVAPEPLPPDHVINEEEKAMLWRSLERIPEIYREPLVLFYREHQSIETVAQDLDLSEDAVKQRLSRGRRLLQEQLMSFVEGALKQTCPGKTFTVGVMAALPVLVTTAKAAAVSTAASKGGTAAQVGGGGAVVAALLSGAGLILLSLFGVFGFAGRWVGRKMGLASGQSLLARRRTLQFFRTLAVGFAMCVLPTAMTTRPMLHAHPWLFDVNTWLLIAFYFVTVGALALWAWQKRRDARRPEAENAVATPVSDKSYVLWVALGTLGPALIVAWFAYATFFTDWTLSAKYISSAEAQKIIAERPDARLTVCQYRNGSRTLDIRLPENGRTDLTTRVDESLLAFLGSKGVAYATLIEDLDFHDGGFQGWLVLLCTFITVAGAALLLRRPGTRMFYEQEAATPRAERREKRVFAVIGALGMIFLSGLLLLMTVAHAGQHVSRTTLPGIIDENANARFDLFQFSDGSKELWITPVGSRRSPRFIAPGDESTLALLAGKQVSYKTYVQGRDFGFRGPAPWFSLTCSLLLAVGAGRLVWWVVAAGRSLPKAAAP